MVMIPWPRIKGKIGYRVSAMLLALLGACAAPEHRQLPADYLPPPPALSLTTTAPAEPTQHPIIPEIPTLAPLPPSLPTPVFTPTPAVPQGQFSPPPNPGPITHYGPGGMAEPPGAPLNPPYPPGGLLPVVPRPPHQ